MTTGQRLVFLAALGGALVVARPAAAQQQTIQDRTISVKVNLDGQPQSGVSIFTLAGGDKFSPTTPPVAVTNSTGSSSVLLSGLLSPNKPHTQLEITVQVCVDGKKQVFIIPVGSENLLPKDTNDCKTRRIGAFWFDGGPNVVVEIGQNPGVTQTGEGTGAPVPGNSLVTVWAGGGIGFKNIGGTSGQISAFQSAFPGGTFKPGTNAFAGELNGAVNVGFGVFGVDLWRANASDSNGSGPLLGGGTDTARISQQNQGIDLTAGARIPLGNTFSVSLFGGGNFWHATIDTRETVASGTTTNTSNNTIHVTGTGWMVGTRLQAKLTHRMSAVVGWSYLPLQKGPVDIHLNEASFGVMFSVFGAPAK